jgi:hypothetical protein
MERRFVMPITHEFERECRVVCSVEELDDAIHAYGEATIDDGTVLWQTTAERGSRLFMEYFATSSHTEWPLTVYKGHTISATWARAVD